MNEVNEPKTNLSHIVPAFIVACLLFVATLSLPYGYYQFLRWAVCGVSVFLIFKCVHWKLTWPIWVFSVIAILFNPLAPIELSRDIWVPIDITVAVIFLISTFVLLGKSSFKISLLKIWHELSRVRKISVILLSLAIPVGICLIWLVQIGFFEDVPKLSEITITRDVKDYLVSSEIVDKELFSIDNERTWHLGFNNFVYLGKGKWQGTIDVFERTSKLYSFVNRGSYISWEYSEKTRAVNLISIGEIVEIEPETSSPATPSTPSGRGIVVPPLK